MEQFNFDFEPIQLPPSNGFPNNERCPVLVYRHAFDQPVSPHTIEQRFTSNGWTNGWRAGVYSFDHFHSTAHEALGCFAGSAQLQLGGPNGQSLRLTAGDVVVIPAGVAHKSISSSDDFCVVGAYAEGKNYDMNYGDAGEKQTVERQLAALPLPKKDPLTGGPAPLLTFWKP